MLRSAISIDPACAFFLLTCLPSRTDSPAECIGRQPDPSENLAT